MSWLDIILLVVLLIIGLIGFKKGFIKPALVIIGIIAGIILAAHYYDSLGSSLGSWLENSIQANTVGFAIILISVILVALVLAYIIRNILRLLFITWLDGFAGAVLSLIVGVVSLGTLLALVAKFQGAENTMQDSDVAHFLIDRFYSVLSILPHQFDAIRNLFV
jgi:membrane protein required for colicin V production